MSSYHHGNLREALIEAGIRYMNDNGEMGLSLRKISAACGVSHAAMYTHFKDKNELMNAMRDFINEQFIEALKNDIDKYNDPHEKFVKLGRNYVRFFIKNPFYFSFLYKYTGITIDLDNLENEAEYLPFEFYKSVVIGILQALNIPKEAHLQNIVTVWGIMIGVVSVAVMKSTQYSGDWEELATRVFTENILLSSSITGRM